MALANNALIVRRVLLERLVRLWKNGELIQEIDRLPLELTPRNKHVHGRCCTHKERAVWKYKSFPLMGFDMNDEIDELDTLSHYAKIALERKSIERENILCVIDEACTACVQTSYEITSLCKGCVARPCMMNCPKNAIRYRRNGQATIEHEKCINCGICKEACPYHCIVYIPIPCEEVCPVKAITKDEFGIEHIDESKCIYCGKCINACPFGSIFEVSQVFDILSAIQRGEEVVAICAPSIMGQYDENMFTVFNAIKTIGFTDVLEVAHGAMETTRREADELKERLEQGAPFMTTSCCPSYTALVEKHLPEMNTYVSHTGSPMYYSARMAKTKYPNAKIVFVGPCVAKRYEARKDDAVDYVMTFEELGAVMNGLDIVLKGANKSKFESSAQYEGRAFGKAGGVIGAVRSMNVVPDLNAISIANLNKKNIGLLRAYSRGKAPGNFIEVMACEGGCITGPSAHIDGKTGGKFYDKRIASEQEE